MHSSDRHPLCAGLDLLHIFFQDKIVELLLANVQEVEHRVNTEALLSRVLG
jgi:hypothetical protein